MTREIPTSALSAGALLVLAMACSSSDDPAPRGGGGDAGDAAAGAGGAGTGGSGAGGAAGTPTTGGAAGTPATGGAAGTPATGGTGGTGAAGSEGDAGDLDAGADAATNGDEQDASADAATDGSEPDAAEAAADAGADGDQPNGDAGLVYLDFAGCTHAAATDETGEGTVTIDVENNFYSPACVRVSAGTNVQWVGNSGTHPLHSMSVNGDTWDDPVSGGTDHTISRTMSTAGSFGYFCGLHGSDTASGGQMTGVVYVEAD